MRITGSQVGPVTPAQLAKLKKTAPTASETNVTSDQVSFSSDVEVITAARKAIAETPEIRQDRVEALRREIQAGTYEISPEKIADKILTESQLFRLGQK